MLRPSLCVVLAAATACGGGGGAVVTAPVATTTRLAADAIEIGAGVNTADLLVRLASAPAPGPCLLEVAVELPAALTLPANDRLQAAAPVPDLDGDFVGNRFVVMCGDAQNAAASALPIGPLFRLRLTPTTPRQPGTYTVRLLNLRAATAAGGEVAVEPAPTVVEVVVR